MEASAVCPKERGGFSFALVDGREEKQGIVRVILESLPEWFALEDGRESYVRESAEQTCLAAFDGGEAVGFLCLRETGRDTVEISVMGVRPEFHRRGIGRELFRLAKKHAAGSGYSFMQVKTVRSGLYEGYDATNRFYRSLGFKEFEVFPGLWDKDNPCQVYVMDATR